MKTVLKHAALAAAFALGAPAVLGVPAAAQNVAEITCRDISEDNIMPLAIWLDGYRAAQSGSTHSDEHWMRHVRERLLIECEDMPEGSLFPLLEEMIRRY